MNLLLRRDGPRAMLVTVYPEPPSEAEAAEQTLGENEFVPNAARKWRGAMVVDGGPAGCPRVTRANCRDVAECEKGTGGGSRRVGESD